MNNCIIILICWVVFSVILVVCDKFGEISFEHDLVFAILTAPISIPLLLVLIPVAFIVKFFNKFKNKIHIDFPRRRRRRF